MNDCDANMTSMNDCDANMTNVKRARSETADNDVPLKRQRVEYERFEEWRARYVDDPSHPPIKVECKFSNNIMICLGGVRAPFPTEAELRATFEKYGPIKWIRFSDLNENVSSPNFGRPWFAFITFACELDAQLAREGENWRWQRLKEERERKALLASSLPQ